MEGDTDGFEQHMPGPQRRAEADAGAELLGCFGPVGSTGLEAEFAALVEGPPWHPVAVDELGHLLAAHRQARDQAQELRSALLEAGFAAGEFPELCGSVDAQGRGVVRIGTVSLSTATRLRRVLRAGPIPPAEHGKAA